MLEEIILACWWQKVVWETMFATTSEENVKDEAIGHS